MKNIKLRNSTEKLAAGNIICVGRNYAEHAKELGNEIPAFPILFMKPTSTLIFSGDKIIHPDYSEDMHHEVELVILIGEDVKNADDNAADKAIAGYAVGLDMTLRDIQNECKANGHPWILAKSFDTGAVVSDFILKNEYNISGEENINLSVNDEVRQSSTLSKMIFSPIEIVKYISSKFALQKGDMIFTGTPEGVGKVNRGDIIKAEISGIGNLENKVL